MTFNSILYETRERISEGGIEAPSFFVDLNLDQIVDAITAGREEYNLKPFFYLSLKNVKAIKYRHEVMQDLENAKIFEYVKLFSQEMQAVREHLAKIDRLYYKYQKEAWLLEAVETYCEAINYLADGLSKITLKSHGLLSFREYLSNYVKSSEYKKILSETKETRSSLSSIKYCMLINGDSITVKKYDAEIDYSAVIEHTFEKFKQGEVLDYDVKFSDNPERMNHIEAKILDFLAKLYPDIFLKLENYHATNSHFMDDTITVFDREIQFYIAYLEYAKYFKRKGLKFCYPEMSTKEKDIYNKEGFDLALTYKIIRNELIVVCNDFYLKDEERIFVVSGPNQGGKTTFARTFGQLHYLASIGCPVPGSESKLYLFDQLFTHFEREEDITNLRGKLQDDLIRIHDFLDQATPNSIIIMNEIFTSTTLQDATYLSKKIMEKIVNLNVLCVWITFIQEIASFSKQTVSMVSTVVPENPTLRTFKILRMPAEGLSYAMAIARKYQLTYDCLKERIKS